MQPQDKYSHKTCKQKGLRENWCLILYKKHKNKFFKNSEVEALKNDRKW